MARASPLILTAGLLLALLLLPGLAPLARGEIVAAGSLDGSRVETSGGSTILLEQSTATWCEVCEEVDPIVEAWQPDAGDRVARVALHPEDRVDVLGTPIATHRELRTTNPGELAYPSFYVEGRFGWEGLTTYRDLEVELQRAEGARPTSSALTLATTFGATSVAIEVAIELTAETPLNGTQLTLFLVEDHVPLTPVEAINGIRHPNDVARALLEVSLDDVAAGPRGAAQPSDAWSYPAGNWTATVGRSATTVDLEAALQLPLGADLWRLGIIAVHEWQVPSNASGPGVLGVVQLVQETETTGGLPSWTWQLIVALLLVTGVALLWQPAGREPRTNRAGEVWQRDQAGPVASASTVERWDRAEGDE